MKDCTTCKYGYEDERLGIPMCHHPKRFSEDCIDFNMHEEKEIKESEKPVPADLEEAADKFAVFYDQGTCDGVAQDCFIAGAKWQAEKDARDMYMSDNRHFEKVYQLGKKDMKEQMMKDAVDADVMLTLHDKTGDISLHTGYLPKELGIKCDDKVKIIIVKEN